MLFYYICCLGLSDINISNVRLMQEVLHIHDTVFWVDSSVRLHTANLQKVYKQMMTRGRGLLMFLRTCCNIFMVTHFKMYWYLPMNEKSTISVKMHGAGVLFVCSFKEVGTIWNYFDRTNAPEQTADYYDYVLDVFRP